jgi:type II secretory pathway pseudopilin PulG
MPPLRVLRIPRKVLLYLGIVLGILLILIALCTVGIIKALNSARAASTQAMLNSISGALAVYHQRWDDYPPSTLMELGDPDPNALNTGIEALVACLSSRKRGGLLFQAEDRLENVDQDSASRNVTDWYFPSNQLLEYVDGFDHVILYLHPRDLPLAKQAQRRYLFQRGGEEWATPVEAGKPGSFELRSVGHDGKPGTSDDLHSEP